MKNKTILVIGIFIVCLVAIVFIRQLIGGTYKVHHVDFYEQKADWQDFKITNLDFRSNERSLFIEDLSKPGIIESNAIKTIYDFDEILMSWNCLTDPPSGGLYIILSLSPDSSQWYEFSYQLWGGIDPDSVGFSGYPSRIQDIGYLDEDIIRLKKHMRYYRFKVILYPDDDGFLLLERLSVCYTKTDANIREFNRYSPAPKPIEPVDLAIPFKSQDWLPDSIAGLTCSPTSVTMVLNYHGFDYTHLQVSELVYDPYNDIYGNWPYNAQAAFIISKYKTWVGRHNSLGELVEELKDGKPVVLSIAVKEDQTLTGAPYKKSEGHLIVVRGFDGRGNVLVNDPAGNDVDEGMVAYNIDELTDVWVNHNGVAYHIWPEY